MCYFTSYLKEISDYITRATCNALPQHCECVCVCVCVSYVAVVVQQVVGEFEAVEGDGLLDPLRSSSRRVRVEVHSSRGGYISASSDQPRGAVEGVPAHTTSRSVHYYYTYITVHV